MYKTYIETKHENRDRLGPSEMGQAGYLLTRPRKKLASAAVVIGTLRVNITILQILIYNNVRGMFEMNCLFLSGDFKFQVSPKVLISCPRSTPRG